MTIVKMSLVVLMIFAFVPFSHARLGATKAECIKRYKVGKCIVDDDWYVLNDTGMALKRKATPNQGNVTIERITFCLNDDNGGFQVTVDLMNDKAVRIIYEVIRLRLDFQTFLDLLDKNKENGRWLIPPDTTNLPQPKKGNPFYMLPDDEPSVKRNDGGDASLYHSGTYLVVMSSPVFNTAVAKAKKLNGKMKQVREEQAAQERDLKMKKINQQKSNL